MAEEDEERDEVTETEGAHVEPQEADSGLDEGEHLDPLDGVIEDDPGPTRGTRIRLVNLHVLGELVVHYPDRDITFVLDGDAALRAMRIFAYPGNSHLQDVLTSESTARNTWMAINMRDALAMTWVPGLHERAPHVTIDPLPRAVAA